MLCAFRSLSTSPFVPFFYQPTYLSSILVSSSLGGFNQLQVAKYSVELLTAAAFIAAGPSNCVPPSFSTWANVANTA